MKFFAILALAGVSLLAPAVASAGTITAIMGTGIGDADWTVGSGSGIELGLRARVRGQNIQNLTSPGVYTHEVGVSTPGNALWNFDWSITTPNALNNYTFTLDMDYSPTGTDFLTFDPVNAATFDNSFGSAATAAGAGVETNNAGVYTGLVASSTKVQNSWNLGFFDTPFSTKVFNPNAAGEYTFVLKAFDLSGAELASTSISVNTVPEPTSLTVFGLAAVGLIAGLRRRRA